MTDTIEGSFTEASQTPEDAPSAPEGQLVTYSPSSVQRQPQTALYELGTMSDEDFTARIATLKSGVARIEQLQRSLLTESVDWGTIPGVPKPFLFKPGAEKLALFYHLVPAFDTSVVVTPQETGIDRIDYTTRCRLHYQSQDGPVLGEGIGIASSWETRYRWRKGERLCPVCGKNAIIKGKAEYGGGWVCFKKKDGCGAKWPDGTQVIENQSTADVENENPHDMANTLAKMSEKRAHVDAVIRATGSSGIFTQDEDYVADQQGTPPTDTAAPPVPSGAAQRGSGPAPAGRGPSAPPAGLTSLTGEVSKVADGIRTGTDGTRTYDVTFKASNRTYHAIAEGSMAERLVRLVKPDVGDPITVEGRYVERPWERDGKKMTPVKELHDITRMVVRDEVLLPLDAAAGTSGTPGTEAAPSSASTTSSDDAPEFGEVGYQMDNTVDIVTAERIFRPKSNNHVVHGTAVWEEADIEFVTTHDIDPPPSPSDTVRLTGRFVAHQGRTILLGTIS